MLNGLWLGFFVVAAIAGFSRWLLGDNPAVFAAMVESLFAMAKLSVEERPGSVHGDERLVFRPAAGF